MKLTDKAKENALNEKAQRLANKKQSLLASLAKLTQLDQEKARQRKILSAIAFEVAQAKTQLERDFADENGTIKANLFTEYKAKEQDLQAKKATFNELITEIDIKCEEVKINLSRQKREINALHSDLMEDYSQAILAQTVASLGANLALAYYAKLQSQAFLRELAEKENTLRIEIKPKDAFLEHVSYLFADYLDEPSQDSFLQNNALPLELDRITEYSPIKEKQLLQGLAMKKE